MPKLSGIFLATIPQGIVDLQLPLIMHAKTSKLAIEHTINLVLQELRLFLLVLLVNVLIKILLVPL
jgi:hypothetical protein